MAQTLTVPRTFGGTLIITYTASTVPPSGATIAIARGRDGLVVARGRDGKVTGRGR